MLPGHLDDGVCGNNLAAVLPSAEGTALFYRGRKFTVGLAEGHLFGFHGGTVGTGAAVIVEFHGELCGNCLLYTSDAADD